MKEKQIVKALTKKNSQRNHGSSRLMQEGQRYFTRRLFADEVPSCSPHHFGWDVVIDPGMAVGTVTVDYINEFLICWDTGSYSNPQSNVYCMTVDDNGNVITPRFLVSPTGGTEPVTAPLSTDGTIDGFAIAWLQNEDSTGDTSGLRGLLQIYNNHNVPAPVTGIIRLDTSITDEQSKIALKQIDGTDDIVLAWRSQEDTFEIKSTIVDRTSTVTATPFIANQVAAGSDINPRLATFPDEDTVYSWESLLSGVRNCFFRIRDKQGNFKSTDLNLHAVDGSAHYNMAIHAYNHNGDRFIAVIRNNHNLKAYIYTKDANLITQFQINTNNPDFTREGVSIRTLSQDEEKLIIGWHETDNEGYTYFRGRQCDFSGNPLPGIDTLAEGDSLSTSVHSYTIAVSKKTTNLVAVRAENNKIIASLYSPSLVFSQIPDATYTEDTTLLFANIYLVKPFYQVSGLITVTITLSDPTLGTLSSMATLTLPATESWSSSIGRLTVTSSSFDEINCYLDNLIFTPTGESSISGTITFIANDGVNTAQTTIQLTGQPVNDPPVVSTNYFPIEQNGQLTLSLANLNATDKDNPPLNTLTVRISNDYYCQFTNENGVVILGTDGEDIEFTLQQVDDAEITLEHTPGSTDNPPEFQITFWDGQAESSRVGAVVIYGGNAIPSFTKNWMEVGERSNTIVTPAYLGIRDDDDDPETVTVDIHDPRNGYFAYKSNPTLAVNTFLYRASVRENLQFFSTNDQEPSYSISLTDDTVTTSPLPAVVTFYRLPTLTTTPLTITEPVEEIPITTDNVQVTNRDTSGNDGDILMEPTITGAHLEATDQRGIAITTPFPYAKMQQEEVVLRRNLGESFSLTWTASNAGFATTQTIPMPITLAFDEQPRVVNNEIPFSPSNSTIFLSPEYVTLAYDFLSPLDMRIGFDIDGWELWQLSQGEWLPITHVTQWEINQGYAKLNATDASNVPHGNLTAWTDDPSQPWLTQPLQFLRLTTHQTHAPSTEAPSQPSSATNSPLSTNSLLPSSTHLNRITQQGTPIPRETNQALNYGLVFGLLAAGFSILAASTTIAYRYWQYRTEKKKQHAETTPKLNGMFDNGLGTSRETSQFNRLSSHSPSAQGPTMSEHSIPVPQPSLEAGQQTEMAQTRHPGMSSPGAQPTSAMWPTPPPQTQALPPPPPFPPQPNSPQVSG